MPGATADPQTASLTTVGVTDSDHTRDALQAWSHRDSASALGMLKSPAQRA